MADGADAARAGGRPSGVCDECGASLAGVSYRGRCLQCRSLVRLSVGRARRYSDAARCLGCGYSLAGRASWNEPGAVCPECGVSMMEARLGSRLPSCSGRSLASLRRGLTLLFWSVIAFFSGLAFAFALFPFAIAFGSRSSDMLIEEILDGVWLVVTIGGMIAGCVCWAAGWFLIGQACADPGLGVQVTHARWVMLRFLSGGVVLLCVVLLLSAWPAASAIGLALTALSLVLLVVSLFAGLVMLRGIAKRAGIPRYASSATQLMVTSPFVVVGVASLFSDGPKPDDGLGFLSGLMSCFAMIWPIWFVLLVSGMMRLTMLAETVVLRKEQAGELVQP